MAESNVILQWAHPIKRQSSYATPNPDADIIYSEPFTAADFGEHIPNMSDNAAMFGKGHEFATRNDILSWDSRFRRAFQASTRSVGWAMAFHLGKVTTTNLGGSPAAYQHVMEYQDPLGAGYYGSGRQQPVQTIIEQSHAGLLRRFPSMAVRAVELTGALNNWAMLGVELQGSGKMATSPAFTFPTSVEGSLLRTGTLNFLADAVDISCDVRSFRFRSEYAYFENEGYCPGSGYNISGDPTSGQIRNKLEMARRAVVLEFQVAATATSASYLNTMANRGEVDAILTLTGDLISGSNYHKVIINIPRFQYRQVPIAADGDLTVYNLSAVILYDDGLANPFEVTVINNIPAYLAASV